MRKTWMEFFVGMPMLMYIVERLKFNWNLIASVLLIDISNHQTTYVDIGKQYIHFFLHELR